MGKDKDAKTTAEKGKSKKQKMSIRRRKFSLRTSRHTSEEDGTQMERDDRTNKKRAITHKKGGESPEMVNVMRQFCLEVVKKGVQGLIKDFQELKATSIPTAQISKEAFDKNVDKNRYKDVFCVDDTRVILTYPDNSNDYIHANWVDLKEEKHRFICTQAPKENTVEDFWRMIWQEKCKGIIMLCNIIECGKKKCEQYWPLNAGESVKYGTISIKNIKVAEVEKMLTQTKLEVSDGSNSFHIEHMAWNNWPDRGVPDNFLMCFRLLVRVKDLPHVVVHCSAGIGRTGTIVGLEVANHLFRIGEKVSLFEIVKELRRQRHGSVQTDIQYVYMHRCIIQFTENKRAVKHEEIETFLNEFEQFAKIRGGPPR